MSNEPIDICILRSMVADLRRENEALQGDAGLLRKLADQRAAQIITWHELRRATCDETASHFKLEPAEVARIVSDAEWLAGR